MRYFRVNTGRYGGELVIGKIPQKELDQFKDADESDIINHYCDYDNETQWHDIDEIEHLSGPYADSSYFVQEEDADGNEIGDQMGPFDYNHLYGREAYISEDARGNETVPVLQMHSAEKGGFGELLIKTEDDFDPDKLYVGIVESDVANLIESYFYDKIDVEPDFDYADTIGKGFYAYVGEMVMKWHDDRASITDEVLTEYFSYLED